MNAVRGLSKRFVRASLERCRQKAVSTSMPFGATTRPFSWRSILHAEMGHKTDRMLAQVYQHLMDDKVRETDEAIDSYFSRFESTEK